MTARSSQNQRNTRGHRPRLQVSRLMKRLFLIACLFAAVIIIGTLGFELTEGWSLFDSFFMALATLTTIGGEVHPLNFRGCIFDAFLMLIGVTTVFVSIALLGETILCLEMVDYFGLRLRDRMLKNIEGHYIVCGVGRVGCSVIQELLRSEAK